MRNALLLSACSVSALLIGCSGDSSSGPSFKCGTVPACYTEAVTALRACVSAPALMLRPVTPMSGTVNGLTCMSAGNTVTFSTFSSSPSGTVPLPSTVTINAGGTFCGEIKSATGTRTDGTGASLRYELTTIRTGTSGAVDIAKYEDGSFGVTCSPTSSQEEVVAPAGSLASCPGSVVTHRVVRNDAITHMGVDLIDASAASSTLFACD